MTCSTCHHQWDLNPGRLVGQPVLLATVPSLQPKFETFKTAIDSVAVSSWLWTGFVKRVLLSSVEQLMCVCIIC